MAQEQTGPRIPMDLHTASACGDYAYVRQQIEDGVDCNKHNIEGTCSFDCEFMVPFTKSLSLSNQDKHHHFHFLPV